MKKWIIATVLILITSTLVYYLYSRNQNQQEIIEQEKGYELVEKVLGDVEVEKLLWIGSDLFIKAGDVIYKYSNQGVLAQEFLQVNQDSTIGIHEDSLIICSWENRLIMTEEEFATEISIINDNGEELHSNSFHETLKIDSCSEKTLSLSNAYPILEEVKKDIDWDGNKVEVATAVPSLTLGGEEQMIVFRDEKEVTKLPLINTVEDYVVADSQAEIAFSTYTNQVWVIYLSK